MEYFLFLNFFIRYIFSLLSIPAVSLILILTNIFIIASILTKKQFSKVKFITLFSLIGFIFLFSLYGLFYGDFVFYGLNKAVILFLWLSIAICIPLDKFYINSKVYKFVFMSFLISLYALYIKFDITTLITPVSQYYRLGDDNINPIIIARLFCIISIFLFFSLFYEKRIYWFISIPIILVSLFFCTLTGSKGPLLAVFISIGLVYLVAIPLKKKLIVSFSFLLLILYMVDISNFNESSAFIEQRFINSDNSYSSRLLHWNNVISNINGADLAFGNGLGSYSNIYHSATNRSFPHNILLELLYETGLFGMLAYMFICIYLIFSFLKIEKKGVTVLTLMSLSLFSIISSMFSGDLIANADLIAVLIFSLRYFVSQGAVKL